MSTTLESAANDLNTVLQGEVEFLRDEVGTKNRQIEYLQTLLLHLSKEKSNVFGTVEDIVADNDWKSDRLKPTPQTKVRPRSFWEKHLPTFHRLLHNDN